MTLTIGQLAREAYVNRETIRYYERRGLMPAPVRNENGYRQYTLDALHRVRFIKKAQALGFSLKEIVELLHLRVEAESTCADVKERIKAKIDDVDRKITALERIRDVLSKLHDRCPGEGPVGGCPFLEELHRMEEMT